jgi:competence protein ComEC
VARLVHLPTSLLVGWVAGVARVSAALPLGDLDGRVALLLAALLAVGLAARTRQARLRLAVIAALVLLVGPISSALRPRSCTGCPLDQGVRLWRSNGAVVLVVESARPRTLLARVRSAGVGRIDLLVLTRPGFTARRAVDVLATRVAVARVVSSAGTARAGPWRVVTTETARGIEARVEPLRSPV